MKKIAVFTMAIIVALICSFAFTACIGTNAAAPADVAKLVMNKRYIRDEDVGKDADKRSSYVFHANGTGEYTEHYDNGDTVWGYHQHYVIHFKYTYVDGDKSSVACFYDSIERLEGDDGGYETDTTWSCLVTVSKNVLTTVGLGYTFWINEDYLKTIPHFGEQTD